MGLNMLPLQEINARSMDFTSCKALLKNSIQFFSFFYLKTFLNQ